ncbi:hypothetical protein [Pseudomonas cremoricolorata]|uniref:hypothetical protein n=1 Tax=Pseudomonas cremoricolorata TaxID=157783 RepID=UPI001427B001|nr:hypothetical protein [Pseudomonas cremoricolorata]
MHGHFLEGTAGDDHFAGEVAGLFERAFPVSLVLALWDHLKYSIECPVFWSEACLSERSIVKIDCLIEAHITIQQSFIDVFSYRHERRLGHQQLNLISLETRHWLTMFLRVDAIHKSHSGIASIPIFFRNTISQLGIPRTLEFEEIVKATRPLLTEQLLCVDNIFRRQLHHFSPSSFLYL